MSIKQNGGVFGRNPTFNDVTIEGDLIINGEVFTGLDFQGSWNASTNSPTLASSVGTNGEFYIVSIAGGTNLNGITNWGIGDWAIFNGTAWQRVEGGADGNFNDVTVAGTLGVTGQITANGGIALGDDDKAVFGAGSDLEIYHTATGNHSIIEETGGGNLVVRTNGSHIEFDKGSTEYMARMIPDGAVELYYDSALKLATTNTGIDVVGTATMDGLTVDVASGSEGAKFSTNDATAANNAGILVYNIASATAATRNSQLILDPSGANASGGDYLIISAKGDNSASIINYHATSTLALGTGGIERMRIDSSGNLGIGTSSPTEKLQVNGKIKISNGGNLFIDSTATDVNFAATGSQLMRFEVNGAERMRIDSSGSVLVGKTSTNISSTGIEAKADGQLWVTRNGNPVLSLNRKTSDGSIAVFYKDGATVGSVSVTGSATAYNTSSDYRLKEDDVPMTGATERVKALRPINFAWKADGSRVDGFFAHEAGEVVPECATGTKDAMQDEEYEVTPAVYEDVITPAVEAVEGIEAIEAVEAVAAVYDDEGVVVSEAIEAVEAVEGVEAVEAQEATTESVLTTEAVMGTRSVPDYQGIDQSKLVPLLTAALQEAITKIEELTTRIETLEGQ
jgi:hypothetical protein